MELLNDPQTQVMIGLIVSIIGAYSAGYMHGYERCEAKQKNNDF